MRRLLPTALLLAAALALALTDLPPAEAQFAPVGASVGPTGPGGLAPQLQYPPELERKNIGSPPPRGPGCCVFRSIDNAGQHQNVPCLYQMPEWMVSKRIAGGGWPEKVDQLIPQIARDRGAPTPDYVQVEGMDIDLLKLATRTGRMPCVTYSVSATGRYGGQRISHMVNLVAAGAGPAGDQYAVMDNNYVGGQYEWLSEAEFRRTYAPGWCVILLAPAPPPPLKPEDPPPLK